MNRRAEFLERVNRVVVKVGSQVVAPEGRLNERALDRLCDGLLALRGRGIDVVLVTSGAVAAGARLLGLRERPKTIPLLQASAAAGQAAIIQSYGDRLRPRDQPVAQILLTADDVRDRRRFINARNTFSSLLSLGVVPIVNENDTVAVEEIKLGDNDRLSSLVANLIEAQLLIVLSDVDGFYDADPRNSPTARRYGFIEEISKAHLAQAGPTSSGAGLGGMATKLEAARQAALCGAATVIAKGDSPRVLEQIMDAEEIGTWFAAGESMSARKHWIAFSSDPLGAVVLDAGAVEALMVRNKSLLPSGIVRVLGSFARGETIRIADQEGTEIGRGLAGYSSHDLDRIRGRRSSEIESLLGYKYFDEAIHRDNLVLI